MAGLPYDEKFFEAIEEGSLSSAQEIVPLVISLLRPASVLDVGCGAGAWLSVFAEHGVAEFLGVDGGYLLPERLLIPRRNFKAHDLNTPLRLGRSFDLVVSLEVAEHLPPDAAPTFVQSIARHAPAVLFSAAIPFQGGENHLNEQWPEYWAERFEALGYLAVDCIRTLVWANDRVDWWYAQNALLFARKEIIDARPLLREEFGRTNPRALSIVHPTLYLARATAAQQAQEEHRPRPLARARELGGRVLHRLYDKSLGRALGG